MQFPLVNMPFCRVTACELTSSCDDIAGFEAIRALHRQLDDDASGTVDISETDEFIRLVFLSDPPPLRFGIFARTNLPLPYSIKYS